jgi:rod shape-determining protein MreC
MHCALCINIVCRGGFLKDFLQTRSFKILVVVLLLLIVLMLYSAATGGRQNVFSSVFSFFATPVQKLSSLMTGSAGDITGLDSPAKLKDENEALKKKLTETMSSMIEYEQVMKENQLYRQLLSIKEDNPDFEFVPSTVIGRSPTDVFHSFTIEKGSLSGISLYDPVLTVDGLVGYITEIGPVSAKVTSVLDAAINVSAFDRRTLDGGTVTGDVTLAKQGLTKIKYLKRDCDVAAGDIIVTEGLGGIFPKNLVVGEVKEVRPEAQDISLYAVIQPAADARSCRDVFVLVSFKGKGAAASEMLSGGSSE